MELSKTIQERYKTQTFAELAKRVSSFVGQNDEERSRYYDLILRKRFIPAGNNLLAGIDPIRPNCVVLPPVNENNLNEIVERSKLLWSARIGIGFDLSTAQDPVMILRKLSKVNGEIKLGHRPQRGNMAVLKDTHLCIKEFVNCKTAIINDSNELYNFNISVGWTDTLTKEESNSLLDIMSQASWACGDPGIVFLNRVQGITGILPNSESMKLINDRLGFVHTTVPCGEQSMFSSETCTLGSINIACPDFWTTLENGEVILNEEILEDAIRGGVNFLDNVIDLMDIPDEECRCVSMQTRRIGLGIMGWADALTINAIKYGTEESYKLGHKIGFLFKKICHDESSNLGMLKSPAPILEGTGLTRRNMMITCCPPTGGITLLTTNKGFGVEPFFSEANSLSSETHIQMQLTWQNYMDNCISKTINMSYESTTLDIKNIWLKAIKNNLKCITVYRDGSHADQPLKIGDCKSGSCDI